MILTFRIKLGNHDDDNYDDDHNDNGDAIGDLPNAVITIRIMMMMTMMIMIMTMTMMPS